MVAENRNEGFDNQTTRVEGSDGMLQGEMGVVT
jgi:hypothetical protein